MVIVFAAILFGLRFVGDPTPFLFGTLIYLLDAVLFGMLIASRVNTQIAAVQGVAMTGFMSAILLSGFLYPVRNIQFPFNYVSYVVPARYYMMLIRDACARGSGWEGMWQLPLVLLVFMFLYFCVCVKTWSRMQISS